MIRAHVQVSLTCSILISGDKSYLDKNSRLVVPLVSRVPLDGSTFYMINHESRVRLIEEAQNVVKHRSVFHGVFVYENSAKFEMIGGHPAIVFRCSTH